MNACSLSVVAPLLVPDDEFSRMLHSLKCALAGRTDYEVIVVCPAMHIDTVVASFPWCRVIAESRRGIYAAMNDGIAASCGRYLYFIGKDDMALPALSRFLDAVLLKMPLIAFAGVYWGSVGFYPPIVGRYSILRRNSCHQGILYSREVFRRFGLFLRRFKYQSDHYMNIRVIWNRGSATDTYRFDEPVAWYSGSGQSEQVRDLAFRRYFPAILRRYLGCWAVLALLLLRLVKSGGASE